MAFWGDRHRDAEPCAPSDFTPSTSDDLLVIGEDVTGTYWVHRSLEFAVRTLGSCFFSLGVVTIFVGVVSIAATFGVRNESGVAEVFEGDARDALPNRVENGIPQLLWVVAPPVLVTVIFPWLFFRIGRGLHRLSPTARWAALVFLAMACVPPLVLFFTSARVGFDSYGAWAVIMLIGQGTGVFVLTTSQSDLVFSPEYRTSVRPEPDPRALVVSRIVGVLLGLALVMTIVLMTSGH